MGEKARERKGAIVESLTETAGTYSAEGLKKWVGETLEGGAELAADFGIDTVFSFIPGVGHVYTSLKYNRRFNRIEKMYKCLSAKVDIISKNLATMSDDDKGKLDDIAELMYEKVADTIQEEKIEYMVKGFVYLSEHEELSFDIAYMYYDMLDRLTLLDLGVLKFYSTLGQEGTYENVLEEFNITYDQYNAVRENLSRFGLIQSQVDRYELDDLTKMEKLLNNMQESIVNITRNLNGKDKKVSLYKKDRLKLKSKDNLRISKFGRELLSFFVNNSEE
ncbi:hypothetical protein [Listeria valentina]|uniref:hypothetical protein n=1 Tax=Listeria valentina TaxID=2705293 RepID=UPI001431A002|nr:hypothetical protein [Listeria valentina]